MTMWRPYIQSNLKAVPLASSQVALDRFHVMQHMNEAVDAVRRGENRLVIADNDDRLEETKHLWINTKEDVHPKCLAEFRFLRGSDLESNRTLAIKENLRHLWSFRVEGSSHKPAPAGEGAPTWSGAT
jgi:transposase